MYRRTLPIAAAVVALTAAAPAQAQDRLSIRGAGWGHGVGMSQWGAYGFAQEGRTYDRILGHYYTDTALGKAANERVRVLLFSGGSATFTGARKAGGRKVSPSRTYGARPAGGGRVALVSSRGKRLKTVSSPLRVRGKGKSLMTAGERFRGALHFSADPLGGINTINTLRLESYIRGVVPRESPASWPIEALKAQAVAARTYAITTSRGGTFDHYKDTRSQVYGGVAAEVASTDRAIRETAGEVVTYKGDPVITYFFSTSGGETEDVENTSLGTEPKPWLKGVDDPYDDASPHHRWGPVRMSLARADALLGSLVKGRFESIKVLERGTSPRIVRAEIVGSGGRTRVSGATLRAELGLRDTWAFFTTTTTDTEEPADGEERADGSGGAPGGGASIARRPVIAALTGRVLPAPRSGMVVVRRREGRRWVVAGSAEVGRAGRYRFGVTEPGRYRVGAGGTVRVGPR